MNPRPVQHPRPPVIVAALGPLMIKHAARYANIGLYYPALDEQLPVFESIARNVIPELKARHESGG